MKIRRFTGATMAEALKVVKAALGPEAVILDTAAGERGVVVTAAVDDDDGADVVSEPARGPDRGRAAGDRADALLVHEVRTLVSTVRELVEAQCTVELPGADVDLVRLRRRLVAQGVDPTIATALVRATAARLEAGGSVDVALAGTLDTAAAPERRVRVLVGAPGDGKTTTAVKLAVQARREGRRVALVGADTYRVGAAAELETYGRAIGVPVARVRDAGGLTRVLARLTEADLVLVDTAGAGPGQGSALKELRVLAEAAGPDAGCILIASAATAGHVVEQAWEAFAPLGPEACVLTKCDVAAGAAVLGLMWRRGLPVSHVAAGRNVSGDLEVATPDRLARCLLAA
jgi:flagellar biosynthesis protein FlhF